MFASFRQFLKWLPLNKFAFISLLVGAIYWLFPDTGKQLEERVAPSTLHRELIGTWKGESRCSVPNGDMITSGYTRLLSTGEYSYSGEVEIRIAGGTTLQYTALVAGTWKAIENGFILTASDIITKPRALKQLGKQDINFTNPYFQTVAQHLPRLEDFTPRGTSQQYEILEISSARLHATSSDIRGNSVKYEATRQ